MGEQVADQKEKGHHLAHGDAQDGTGGHFVHAHVQRQEIPGQRQADEEFADHLDDLGDSGGHHVPLALGVTPDAGQQAHAEHRRGEGPDGPVPQGLIHQTCQPVGLEEHQQGAGQAQHEKQPDGRAEDLPLFVLPTLGLGLAGHPGDGQRQARGGEGQQNVIDAVAHIEIRLALTADNVAEWNLVDGTQDLYNGDSGGQNGGAAQKGLLFLIRHGVITSNTTEN